MSYCRFVEADAYIYDNVHSGLMCAMCSLMPTHKVKTPVLWDAEVNINENFIAGADYKAMLEHISQHRLQGDDIPLYVDEAIIKDWKH